jgi:hypothetical protein
MFGRGMASVSEERCCSLLLMESNSSHELDSTGKGSVTRRPDPSLLSFRRKRLRASSVREVRVKRRSLESSRSVPGWSHSGDSGGDQETLVLSDRPTVPSF